MQEASIEPTPETRLRYDEAVRTIEHQLASLDSAQTRAGLLLAALTISASELGGRAADRPGNPLPLLQGLAWVALAVAGAALVFALWPRKLSTAFKVDKLVYKPADHLMQDITLSLIRRRSNNENTIEHLWLALQFGMVALPVIIACWGSIVIWR